MRRVVITGFGVVSPIGNTTQETWSAMLEGKSGLGPISYFDASTFPTRIAGEVKNFDFWKLYEASGSKYPLPHSVSQSGKLAVIAAQEAWKHAGLDRTEIVPERAGIYLGAGKGEGLGELELIGNIMPQCFKADGSLDLGKFLAKLRSKAEAGLENEVEPGRIMCHLAEILNARGPVSTCLTACAAGAQAVGEAVKFIRADDADIMIAGGCHSMITAQSIMGFCLLGAMSTDNDNPTKASRPFTKNRNGFVLSEGAALLVLEELEHAKKRGAKIYAELAGYGCTSDAFRVTDPHPEGLGQGRAMLQAMSDAGVDASMVDYINAHGTSTADNDEAETLAIKNVFGERAYKIPVSSTKSMTGHLIAAAGSLEAIVCTLAIQNGIVPPTMNYEEVDPACDLDYVPNRAREHRVRAALTNSFGFGGQNTSLLVKEYTGV